MDQELFLHMRALRRDIHRHPELGFEVQRTAAIVAAETRKLGYTVRTEVGKTGVVCDLQVPSARRTIALRADMDALPIQEESGSSYASSVPGVAHLCGHDAHTAMLLGAAALIMRHKGSLTNNVRLLFQPHEEGPPGGAPAMIADGALEGVDEIYGLHVWPSLKTGEVGILSGPMMAQADLFEIEICGKSGHAAEPHKTIDPLLLGSQLVVALQSLVSRSVDPLQAAVLSVCEFKCGSAYSQIPLRCTLKGTVRSYTPAVQNLLRSGIERLAQAHALGAGAEIEVRYLEGFPPLVNDSAAAARAREIAGAFARVSAEAVPSMAGEDFAYYAQKVAACFIQLGCRNPTAAESYPLHHPCFSPDEECMKIGAALLAGLVREPRA